MSHPLRSIHMLPVLLAILLCTGCSAIKQAPAPTAVPAEDSALGLATAAPLETSDSLGKQYVIDGVLSLSDEHISAAADSGPILHILSGGDLTANGLLLDRSAGTISQDLPVEQQASIFTAQGARAHIFASAVSSDADEAPLFAAIGGSIELSDTMAVSAGANAAALYARDGGSIITSRSDLFSGGDGGSCLFADAGGSITCTNGTRISAAIDGSSTAIHLLYGGSIQLTDSTVSGDIFTAGFGNTMTCTNTTLSGNLRFETAEDEIDLRLLSGSSFLGTTDGDGAIGIRIALDATSRWTLTGDAYVAALSDEDPTLSNIDSGGFSLYYNAESEENLWLGGKSLALNGGGYLIPLI